MRALITAKVPASSLRFLGGAVGVCTMITGLVGDVDGRDAERQTTQRTDISERPRTDADPATIRMRCVVQNTSSPGRRGGGGGVDRRGTEGGGKKGVGEVGGD